MNELRLAALVHNVANGMCSRGEMWVLADGEAKRGFGVDMRSRDGEIVNFWQAEGSAQLVIEVTDPLTAYSVTKPIRVTASRPPLVIAREIANRLLPGAREALAGRRAKEAEARKEFEARAAAVNAAESLFGRPTDFGDYKPGMQGEVTYKTGGRLAMRGSHIRQMGRYDHVDTEFARVETTFDGSLMDIELRNIPRDVAMAVLGVLGHWNSMWPAMASCCEQYGTRHRAENAVEGCPQLDPREAPSPAEFARWHRIADGDIV